MAEYLERLARLNELILDSAGEGIIGLDLQGRIIFANRAAAQILECDAQEMVGHTVHDVLHRANPKSLHHTPENCPIFGPFDGREPHPSKEDMFWRRDATSFPAEYVRTPVRERGELVGGVVVFRDISERKRAEDALRRSEERYRDLIMGLDAIVWELAPLSWQFTFVSQRAESILGYPVERWLTESEFWQNRVLHPEDREMVLAFYGGALSEARDCDFEHRALAADGRVVWLRDIVHVVRDSKGRGRQLRGLMVDISSRRVLEEQFRQAQKMEAVGRLAGGVAHDFNNLLTVITGFAELLLSKLDGADPLRPYTQEVAKAAERAASLTRQLLAFSRKQMLAPEVLDLNALVANMVNMLPRMLGEDIDLITILAPALGLVKVDRGQIEQVIMNLAVNARDAMPHGGKLTIETANVDLDGAYARVHLGVRPGPHVMLAVSDTGSGIDATTIARLFEPFFTTKEPGKGTGLGLATVYGIVEQSGGHIWVYSEPGQGATFKVYLPRVEGAVEFHHQRTAVPSPPLGSETVLLVEDEEMVRSLMREVLLSNGYTVLEASSGEAALEICQKSHAPIHLLLTDVVMTGMSGPQLSERLAALQPETKVLYVSGYTDKGIVSHGVLRAGTAFLQKPFTPDALARKVREVLDEPRAR